MSLDYSGLTTALGDLLQIGITDASSPTPSPSVDFNNILPNIIGDAENRIYRELDFLATRTPNSSLSFAINNRSLTIPPTFLIVQGVSAITPALATPVNGTRNRIELVSLDVLDTIWPQEVGTGATGIPQYGAMLNATTLIVAPTPNAAYIAEFTGIFRPDAMSSTNTTTYIGDTYPDLFLAACMVFATGYQRDFGSQADDPHMAVSWEALYQARKSSVMEEEQRRKGQSTGWSPYSPAPLSTPQRS